MIGYCSSAVPTVGNLSHIYKVSIDGDSGYIDDCGSEYSVDNRYLIYELYLTTSDNMHPFLWYDLPIGAWVIFNSDSIITGAKLTFEFSDQEDYYSHSVYWNNSSNKWFSDANYCNSVTNSFIARKLVSSSNGISSSSENILDIYHIG